MVLYLKIVVQLCLLTSWVVLNIPAGLSLFFLIKCAPPSYNLLIYCFTVLFIVYQLLGAYRVVVFDLKKLAISLVLPLTLSTLFFIFWICGCTQSDYVRKLLLADLAPPDPAILAHRGRLR